MLFSHEPDKVFLIPESCRVTKRNSNSKHRHDTGHHGNIIE